MATVEECREALHTIARRLSHADQGTRDKVGERAISCHLSDLDVTFVGQLRNGGLHDITQIDPSSVAPTFTMSSDDLVALTEGKLGLASAWATGRVRINAGFGDLLTLRSFL